MCEGLQARVWEVILYRILCVAHSNTLGDPPLRLYWFPQTSMHSTVLATAVEEDERGRDGESSRVGGGDVAFVQLIYRNLTIFDKNWFMSI